MSFDKITLEYLKNIKRLNLEATTTGEMTPELSYRPELDKYFEAIIGHVNPGAISKVFEPRKQEKAGRPDWRFHNTNTFGVYGYVESKGLNPKAEIDQAACKEQLKSYLSLGYRVILTDGLDFVFLSPSGEVKTFRLIKKPTWNVSQDIPALESEFIRFFADSTARKISEEQLISDCAARAVILRGRIKELAESPLNSGFEKKENETIRILHELKKIVNEHHDPVLKNKDEFASFVSQVLIFGLIYAHRVISTFGDLPPKERYVKIKRFWKELVSSQSSNHLKPFRALVELLQAEIETLGTLGAWYDDCCLLLAHAKLANFQTIHPDYHKLFEKFHTSFDPKARFDYGVYYTPSELTKYMVGISESVAAAQLPGISIYDSSNKFIDPCCGTGSFLEHLLTAFKAKKKTSPPPQIVGFEILPAPYALAHYRLFSLEKSYPKNLEIVLTNTLSDHLETPIVKKMGDTLFEQEQNSARELAKPPFTLIIGNPPSSDSCTRSQGDGFEIIDRLLNDFRPPAGKRRSRQNTQKQLNNEYVKFLRWSAEKVLNSHTGVLALVLPGSFAENPSYLYARKWLYEHFSAFWFLDLDTDARTGKATSGIFNTLQGRSLLIAVKSESCVKPKAQRQISYFSIADLSKSEKLSLLSGNYSMPEYLAKYSSFVPDPKLCNFRPRKQIDSTVYGKFWSLSQEPDGDNKYIYARHCSGVKLAPSSMFVHVSEPLLKRRSMEIADPSIPYETILQKWYAGQDKPPKEKKFSSSVRKAFKDFLAAKSPIDRYAYRPFLNTPILLSEEILSTLGKTGGGGTRYRPEILRAYSDNKTIGIAVAPAPKDIGGKLHRFASFAWHVPDNDLCKRGNAHVYCNLFPEIKKGKNWDSSPKTNINTDLLKQLGNPSSEEIVYYTYAVLCSELFLRKCEGELFTYAGSSPLKIPFPADNCLFKALAQKGKDLALLEKESEGSESSLKEPYKSLFNKFTRDFKLVSFKIADDTLILQGENIFEFAVPQIPERILSFQVAGYQVLQQWLKLHTYKYTKSEFTREQFCSLLTLLQNIDSQLHIISEIDEKIASLFDERALL